MTMRPKYGIGWSRGSGKPDPEKVWFEQSAASTDQRISTVSIVLVLMLVLVLDWNCEMELKIWTGIWGFCPEGTK